MESRHGTLTTSQVTTVTFTEDALTVTVVNHDTTNPIFFNLDSSANPAVSGDNTYVVLPGERVTVNARGVSAPVVKLISGGNSKYSVIAE